MEISPEFNAKKIEEEIRNHLSPIDLQKLIFESEDKTKKTAFI